MGIFRTRALDAANQDTSLETPLLLPRPKLNKLKRNWWIFRDQISAYSPRGIRCTQEQRQQDPTECGAISLSIILNFYGCYTPISQIRHACGVSRNGSDAANLIRAAQFFGLEAKGFKKGLKSLEKANVPAILFWNFNHFVVLDGIKNNHYWINDPACGRRRIDSDEFDRCYTGVILTMKPGVRFQRTPNPAGSLQLMAKVIRQIEPNTLITLTACIALASYGISAAMSGHLWGSGRGLSILALSLMTIPVAQMASRQLQTKASQQLQKQLLQLPSWVVQQHSTAELSSRLNQLPSLARDLNQHGWINLPLFTAIILSTLALANKHPLLAGVIGAGIILYGSATTWLEHNNSGRRAQERIAARKPNEVIQMAFQDPEGLKASCLEQDYLRRWAGRESEATRTRQELAYSRDLQSWVPKLIGWSTPLWLLGLGISSTGATADHPTQLLFISMGLILAQQRWQLLQNRWHENTNTLQSIRSIEEQPIDPLLLDATEKTNTKPPHPQAMGLELVDISFSFLPVQIPLIADLNLKIPAGQRVAIVGASASGKSTLVRVIAGLLQPQQGVVKLQGKPLMSWPRQDRAQAIAMVSQGMPLISCTLAEALTFWDTRISKEAIQEACHNLGILAAIESLRDQFNTPMNEACQVFSGGECQRFQIVQALLQRPGLLILDEATSSLDAKSEHEVQDVLSQLPCTQIIVSHRLSSIRDADQIVVLENGTIIQQGRHNDLAAEHNSLYQALLQLDHTSGDMTGLHNAQPK